MSDSMRSITDEMVSSYILAHQFLTPSTMRGGKSHMIDTIRGVGGLQWGAEDISLLARLSHFESGWIREAVEKKELLEVHVLRGGLRIIPADEYAFYFAGTREVLERVHDRRLHIAKEITDDHKRILQVISQEGRMTSKEIRKKTNLPHAGTLVNGLLGAGKLIRAGRKKNEVLFATLEEWLPYIHLESVSPHESRLWLAKKFFRTYGPATESQLAHWAGWTVTRGKEVISHLKKEGITEVSLGKKFCFMLSDTEFPPKEDRPYVRLLHNDDEIHLACSGRCKALFGFSWKYRFSTTAVVLQNNRIMGEMKISKKKDIFSVEVDLPEVDDTLLTEQIERLAALWDASLDMRR